MAMRARLWGHFSIFGAEGRRATSVSVIIGTGLGGGVIIDGQRRQGRKGFGGELGHVLLPYQNIRGIERAGSRLQLRAHRRSGIGVLADRASRSRFCPTFCRGIPITNWASWHLHKPPSWCADWRRKAIRCAEKFSACRRMRWACSSTR